MHFHHYTLQAIYLGWGMVAELEVASLGAVFLNVLFKVYRVVKAGLSQ